ncbi:MAG TPA: aminomethyl-transferring glycine dehydrogenase [Cytophagaceae bacterium]|jgi:glycine dehydrogenase
MKINLNNKEQFQSRHIGPSHDEIASMLKVVGADSIEQLIDQTIPDKIRLANRLDLPEAKSEYQFLKDFRAVAEKNKIYKTYIGLGYYNCITPGVILRNILENPGWYTAYTPYQAEIAQGRLEALLNFQTMIVELTGMEIANASLLDEGTAAAEAMTLLYNVRSGKAKDAKVFFVSDGCFPQTIDVLKSRAEPLGIELLIGNANTFDFANKDIFGVLLQFPDANGAVYDYKHFIDKIHELDILVAVAADLYSLTLLTPPGEKGADIVLGSSQRFGVPMGFGGPHAAFFATREKFKRHLPGRVIGVSIDSHGNRAYRMALQTREQHIKREKATSNICTAQVLLSVIASSYAVYHGPEGLKNIALRIHGLAKAISIALNDLGYNQFNKNFFDTLKIETGANTARIKQLADRDSINLRYSNTEVFVTVDETTSLEDIKSVLAIFAEVRHMAIKEESIQELLQKVELNFPSGLLRTSAYLTHPVFNSYHSEHEMLRYLKSLENKDLSLTHSMIPLGSCTMKLNATAEMAPVTWNEIGNLHPFAPKGQTEGYSQIFNDLENWLCSITGFAAVSLQPNSGAQGEYAGLMVIREYHKSRGHLQRNIALIPSSAHGTNPASAVMAGMKVVIVKCDEKGSIEIEDLRQKAELYKDTLSALLVTYPSTHGVFEEGINEICEIIHSHGGQVYMDGANMNAQVGLTCPAAIGADVCHLNLHKTFCIPHGGGGPGMGPIGVASHLVPFLPSHAVVKTKMDKGIHAVSSAPWGSASILVISYAYISMMGAEGLKRATELAIFNANYMKARLEDHYPALYSGMNGRCAHEFIIDCRSFKHSVGIEVEDIAKRLMDYGFHAPTVSFPVPGTMMIEPTESESKDEMDRFCEAMIAIREEIREIENGVADKLNNALKNAPHTAAFALSDGWDKPYSRQKAVYPLPWVRNNKFWPSVGRIDNAYGDRNLICSCIPVEEYAKEVPQEL